MITLRPNEREYIQADADEQKTVRNVGPATAYYGGSDVTSVSNDGNITAGGSLTLDAGKWFVSAGTNLSDEAIIFSQGESSALDVRVDSLEPRVVNAGDLEDVYTLDVAGDHNVKLIGTLTEDVTITVENLVAGPGAILRLEQDEAGEHLVLITNGVNTQEVPFPTDGGSVGLIGISTPDGDDLDIEFDPIDPAIDLTELEETQVGLVTTTSDHATRLGAVEDTRPVVVTDYGAVGDGVAEPATPFQDAYDVAAVNGRDVFIPAGEYNVDDATATAVISLARDNVGTAPKVRVVFDPGAKFVLSANTPRLFDFDKQADGDTFRNVEINGNGAEIDVNGLGGRHHTIIGTYRAGVTQTEMSLQRITVRGFRVHNILTDEDLAMTNHRIGIYLVPANTAGGTVIEDIVIEDVHIGDGVTGGGNGGVIVGSGVTFDSTTADRWHISRCSHRRGLTPTVAGVTLNSFQFGARAAGGHLVLRDLYSEGAADTACEINAWSTVDAQNVCALDPVGANILLINYGTPLYGGDENQFMHFHDCHVRRSAGVSSAILTRGFKIGSAGNGDHGAIVITESSRFAESRGDATFIEAASGPAIKKISVRDCVDHVEGIDVEYTAAATPASINAANVRVLDVDGLRYEREGAATFDGGSLTAYVVRVSGVASGVAMESLNIDRLTVDYNVTGGGTFNLCQLGISTNLTLNAATIRRTRYTQVTGASPIQGPRIGNSSSLTVTNQISLEDNDFSFCNAAEVRYDATAQTNKVRYGDGNIWPSGSTVTDFAAAATMTVPAAKRIKVTGNTSIDTITALPMGTVVAFEFSGTPTVNHNTGNIKLNSGLSFAAAADRVLILECDGTNWRGGPPGLRARVPFFDTQGGTVWTDMPAAETEIYGLTRNRKNADLSPYTQVRAHAGVGGVAGVAGSELRVQYFNGSTWVALDGGTGPLVAISGSANAAKLGSWVTIVAAARTDVSLRAVGINGDGGVDPTITSVEIELK